MVPAGPPAGDPDDIRPAHAQLFRAVALTGLGANTGAANVKVSARVRNGGSAHQVFVDSDGAAKSIAIAAKAGGGGSSINGGELLVLALATCFCNDLYREAARMGIAIESVEVEAQADFTGIGASAANVSYRARIASPASDDEIEALLQRTDAVAEIHNTLRAGVPVVRRAWER